MIPRVMTAAAGCLMLAVALSGCHLLFPFSDEQIDSDAALDAARDLPQADAPPDASSPDAVQLDDAGQPDSIWLDAQIDSSPFDASPDLTGPADATPPDAPSLDMKTVDMKAVDAAHPKCPPFSMISEDFSSAWWTIDLKTGPLGPVKVNKSIQFGAGDLGAAIRHSKNGLFCASSGKTLKVEFKHTCTDGSLDLMFYSKYYATSSLALAQKELFSCSAPCQPSTTSMIVTCTPPSSTVAQIPIYSMVVGRRSGAAVALATSLRVNEK